MSRYDYFCPSCNHEVEVLQWSLTEKVVCIHCGALMERRFPGNQMIKMKGEGGYPSRHKQVFNTTKRIHPKLD